MTPAAFYLPVIYRDDDLVIIHKPPGLLVHRSALARGERWFAMQLLRDQLGQHVYPVHRLDRPTCGLLVFALHQDAARRLSQQFEQQQVRKIYHAVVRGWLPADGVVDHPLREELDKIADRQARTDKAAQPAMTRFQTLRWIELPYQVSKRHATSRYALVRLEPKTGRKHQLRRHMAHLRHPIVGDTNHGDGRHNQFFRRRFGCHRLLLSATGLELRQPYTQALIRLRQPLPDALLKAF